ncbi:uncharacterized protein HKW66_Vig0119480 [Vigna angularis]|uniref:Uncharacterized protein n=1 Tax=Phaseolus angularis TaxID=3914 RepID=A0A8T0JWB3_PHAAN|nr:uncharacterized protein HKW66_Vig0119480 [Vigna angularis]
MMWKFELVRKKNENLGDFIIVGKTSLELVKGDSHASICGSRSHALIPTSPRNRPTTLPKPIIISVPRPHCWKGSASKLYVELPPHTAPLGMKVGPAQAYAVLNPPTTSPVQKKTRVGNGIYDPPIWNAMSGAQLSYLRNIGMIGVFERSSPPPPEDALRLA